MMDHIDNQRAASMAGPPELIALSFGLWWTALLVGTAYWVVPLLLGLVDPMMLAPIHGITVVWKGLGVGLLALWALLHGHGRNGLLLAAVMAFGALGDVLLDAVGLAAGALAFAIGHLLAIWLYARNRRDHLTTSQRALAMLVVPLSLLLTWLMVRAAPDGWQAVVYTAFVAVMAAMAWTSRFPRYVTGIGAIMFLASDLVIFARESGSVPIWVGAALIWPLYLVGQALIARGVLTTLAADAALSAAPQTAPH